MLHLSFRMHVLLAMGLIAVFSAGVCFADSPENDDVISASNEYHWGVSMGGGIFGSTEMGGLSANLKIFRRNQDTVFTLRNSLYIDVFDTFLHCTTEQTIENDDECQAAEDGTPFISEIALMYGRKWGRFWLSGGLGYVESENMHTPFSDDSEGYTATGFAYSVLWLPLVKKKWGGGLELYGNLSSETRIVAVGYHLEFTGF